MAARQLRLLQPDDEPWRLDAKTKAAARRGIADARAALAAARTKITNDEARRAS